MTGFTKPNKKPYVIGVAGGSGSGKTYFAAALQKRLGSQSCAIVYQDSFYIDQSARFDFDGGSVNFDHPNSIDFNLLAQKIAQLKSGQTCQIPVYDFVTHSRKKDCIDLCPTSIVLVDGILIFHSLEVRSLFDDLVFFDTPEALRYQRRLDRDVHERGRTPEGVLNQFTKQVKPMHDSFVEPSKVYANTYVRDLGEFDLALEDYVTKLKKICED